MSFLGDLFKAGTGGIEDAVKSAGRGFNDLAQGDFDSFTNESENTFDNLAGIPGTDFSLAQGLYQGANGDMSWNPYDEDISVWDQAAGGSAANDPNNRKWGRTIGTLVGSYFTGGALGSALGSSTGGAAASGALWGAGQAAGSGGDRDQIGKSALYGALGGAGSGWIDGMDAAGAAGIENTAGRNMTNRFISGALTTAAQPGTDRNDIARGATYNSLQGLGSMFSNNDANPYAMEFNDTTSSLQPANKSVAPWATPNTGLSRLGVSTPQMSYAPTSPNFNGYQEGNSFATPPNTAQPSIFDQVSQLLGSRVGNSDFNQLGNYAEGLMGLYSANRQRRQAKDMLGMVGGRRGAYESSLRGKLMAKDAASGRRSNYAGRETQLQGMLAELDSRNAPAMMALDNAQHQGTVGMLQSLLRTGSRAGMFRPSFDSSPMTMPMSLSQLSMPQVASLQNQIDPMDWNRTRRPDQFGG